jgi:hypothetical protein
MCRNHRAYVDRREPKLPPRVLPGRVVAEANADQTMNAVNIMNIAERMGYINQRLLANPRATRASALLGLYGPGRGRTDRI